MKIYIAGHQGMVGSAIVRYLLNSTAQSSVLSSESSLSTQHSELRTQH